MTDGRMDHAASDELRATGSGWTFNWRGALSLLLVGVIVLVGWRWFGGSAMGPDDLDDEMAAAAAVTTVLADSDGDTTTTTATTAATTTAPTTTSTTPTTVPERAVHISGEMKPCRFGSNCLVASFAIVGFDEHPGRFVCIYPNSRRDFGFNRDAVDDACMTADAGDSIAIEVDGVVSATVSEQDLDGT